MPSPEERNRIYAEISVVKSRIGQIGAEIGRRRNQIDSLKSDNNEQRDLHRTFSREAARLERLARRGNYVREPDNGVINTERTMFNIQCKIDQLYSEIDALFREKNELFQRKTRLYEQLQNR